MILLRQMKCSISPNSLLSTGCSVTQTVDRLRQFSTANKKESHAKSRKSGMHMDSTGYLDLLLTSSTRCGEFDEVILLTELCPDACR